MKEKMLSEFEMTFRERTPEEDESLQADLLQSEREDRNLRAAIAAENNNNLNFIDCEEQDNPL